MEFLPSYGILLEDVQGFSHSPSYSQELVHKGSLVIRAESSDVATINEVHHLTVNYKLDIQSTTNTFLFANSRVVFCISSLQRDFLLGVNSLDNRLLLLGTKLKWMESLKIGSHVLVTISTDPLSVRGTVRYIGNLSGKDGTHFGIELLVCNSCEAVLIMLNYKHQLCIFYVAVNVK